MKDRAPSTDQAGQLATLSTDEADQTQSHTASPAHRHAPRVLPPYLLPPRSRPRILSLLVDRQQGT